MRFLRKYWYIWFGIFAFPILNFTTDVHIARSKKRGEITADYAQFLRKRSGLNFLFLGVVIMGIPFLVLSALTDYTESIFLQNLIWICFHLCCVLATYLHARWREKHLGHLLKKRSGDD